MFSALYWSVSWSLHRSPTERQAEQFGEGLDCAAAIGLQRQLQHCREQLQGSRLRRARSHYLYFDHFRHLGRNSAIIPKKGNQVARLCDLYLDGGQALHGHSPNGVTARLKNVMSRGLYSVLPGGIEQEGHLRALLSRLFPHMQDFRLYHSLAYMELFQKDFSVAQLLCFRQSAGISLWRPLSPEAQQNLASCPFTLPVPALSTLPLPYLILSHRDSEAARLPPSDICSPIQMEALIQAFGRTESLLLAETNPTPSKVTYGNQTLEELRRTAAQLPNWHQDGIYLYRQGAETRSGTGETAYTEYTRLWQQFFEHGFLLPPNPWAPVLFPPTLLQKDDPTRLNSEGKKLQRLLDRTGEN
ncbi:hypothetical protein P0082_08775 [Candidatus Haliotispira prima]|uniref:Uncharacterized protein n=1 Tax=Candidatus Haliotispira prima TaxID=3034016 RepID=A0ABY8MF10_9SPIO|nr:hypothetical protein P0082_08775 [Candidatus Haliotispira prima]